MLRHHDERLILWPAASDLQNASLSLWVRAIALLVWVVGLGAGCDEPCVELEDRVCEHHDDRLRCDLMQDPDRRALLSDEACESMLRVVPVK